MIDKTNIKNISKIIDKLKERRLNGEVITKNGTLLICKVPHIAPEAWLHSIYEGLSDYELKEVENKLGKKLPDDLYLLLKEVNGMNIFSDSISIFGKRISYAREGEESFQPYDLADMNEELDGIIPANWIAFAGYNWDGSTMYYDINNDNSVFICERDSKNKLKVWSNIFSWLSEEVIRLSDLYDEKGIEKDEDVPTIPY
ncbi:MAG: SMI1/KNR4 family protein [Eubacteriaceae bacterium]|nr:SMI1/KNR4 family protein [Eubacteriaceae bacterium]